MSLKVLQLSDLHFCVDEVRGTLDRLAETAGWDLLGDLELGFANEEVLDSLKELVAAEDPDVLVVTGDVTAFGDAASFQVAGEWLDEISSRRGGGRRQILSVPGHHDALRHQLSFLATRSPFKSLFQEPLALLTPFLDPDWKQDRYLEPYRDFIKGRAFNSEPPIVDNGYAQLCFFSFASLCNEPWWMMSAGAPRKAHWQMFKRQLSDPKLRKPGMIRVVLTHHNPICSPGGVNSQKFYAYRSMPGSMEFLRVVQHHGVDLVLHGHEQASSICSYDFEVSTEGHVYSVGCPSSSAHDRGGCNVLAIEEPNHVLLKAYVFDALKGQFEQREGIELALERNRPPDSLTRNVRYEIKSYFYKNGSDEGEAWKPLQQNSAAKLIYMSGRKLAEVRETRFEQLSALLASRSGDEDGPRIRILLMDPELAKMLANAVAGKLWGDAENLEKLAKEAQQTLDELTEYLAGISEFDQERVEVRVSHTLLPFGAYVTDPDQPWGKMAVKLLPVGALGDLHSPIIRLNRRQDFTLYHFYLRHLKYLFLKGKPVLGSWRFGDGDLRKEMEFMLRQSR